MNKGWIKLHREILEKPIWTEATPEQKVLLVTLMMMANHSEKQWEWKGQIYHARPGQIVTSLPSLAQKCGKSSSVQKIRTALKRFEKYGFLTDQSTPHNRLITIVNWRIYQEGRKLAADVTTDEQQTPNRQVTANKNDKNDKHKKKSNRRKPVYDEDSIFYQLALTHFEELKTNHSEMKEPNLHKWANDFRLIIERDGRSMYEITHLMKWAAEHDFWHTVILSPSSMRRNWDQMDAQAKQEQMSAKKKRNSVFKLPKPFELDFSKGEEVY